MTGSTSSATSRLPLAYGEDASAGANHTRSSAVWLTCARPETGATPRLGISVDQVAAQSFGQDTPLPSLELSLEEGGLQRRLGPLRRVPQYDRLAHADGTVADGGQSADRVRASVRRRQHGRGARAAPRASREPARLRAGRRPRAFTLVARRRPRASRAPPRGRARGRAPHRARGAEGRRRPRGACEARRRSGRLRAARKTHVRLARAGLVRGPHARRHADDREGGQQHRLRRERDQRSVSQPIASLRGTREHRALRAPERVSHDGDARVFSRASCAPHRMATALCSTTRSCSTAAA